MRLPAILLLALAGPLFGQLESNTLTIVAARALNVQPDQAVFIITIDAPAAKGLDEVLAALQSSGITAANVSNVNTQSDGTLEWLFRLPVSLTKVQSTTASLIALQQTIANAKNGVLLSFYTQGLQVSDALAQSQACPFADLISQARAQAQKVAQAAGISAGPIESMEAGGTAAAIVPSIRTGDFALAALPNTVTFYPLTSEWFNPAPPLPPSCAITVKFQLLRYQ